LNILVERRSPAVVAAACILDHRCDDNKALAAGKKNYEAPTKMAGNSFDCLTAAAFGSLTAAAPIP
jgi:hypothetical protein